MEKPVAFCGNIMGRNGQTLSESAAVFARRGFAFVDPSIRWLPGVTSASALQNYVERINPNFNSL